MIQQMLGDKAFRKEIRDLEGKLREMGIFTFIDKANKVIADYNGITNPYLIDDVKVRVDYYTKAYRDIKKEKRLNNCDMYHGGF